ncbi:hypothetical protein ASF33_18380, partial [Methylobacterium sp. Leaf92]
IGMLEEKFLLQPSRFHTGSTLSGRPNGHQGSDLDRWQAGRAGKDARAYLYIGPSTRISPVAADPGSRPHARSEITIGPLTSLAQETREEVVRAPCVERGNRSAEQ